LLVVILVAKMAKAFRDSLKTGALRLVPEGIVGIGAIYNLAQEH
jgi:hypothetical protein